ncbi:heavy metal-binding domain-containing protein [Halomonas jincaotanensis]|uniref:heavy metal-binding domain-containing protein n=1 Tax=Halomonas jincaotanensis TaxID=2810616 RepID=UPI003873769E
MDLKTFGEPIDWRRLHEHRATHSNKSWYFCSAKCREKFEVDPEAYLGDRSPADPAPPGSIYTCPMHPEVRQEGPGNCPVCGMALEPETVSADTGDPRKNCRT